MGLPVSTTRFADTEVSTGSAVSTDVDSECPTPSFDKPRERMLIAVAKSHSDFAARQTQSGDRVRVPIRFKSTGGTRVFPNPQRFLGFYTTRRTLFGRIFRVDRHKVRAFAFTLVFQHPLERPPRRRCSVPRVTGEFDQSFRVQIFDSHEIVFSGVVVRQSSVFS